MRLYWSNLCKGYRPLAIQWDKAYVESRVARVPFSGCWLWLHQVSKNGYPMVRRFRSPWKYVHRLSHELWKGAIPQGMDVCHKCHVRSCVNPEHIYAGTRSENMRDMLNAGRQSKGPVKQEVCRRGHPLNADTRLGRRAKECKVCHALRQAAYREARKSAVD